MFLFKHSLKVRKAELNFKSWFYYFLVVCFWQLLYLSNLPFPDNDNYILSSEAIIWLEEKMFGKHLPRCMTASIFPIFSSYVLVLLLLIFLGDLLSRSFSFPDSLYLDTWLWEESKWRDEREKELRAKLCGSTLAINEGTHAGARQHL